MLTDLKLSVKNGMEWMYVKSHFGIALEFIRTWYNQICVGIDYLFAEFVKIHKAFFSILAIRFTNIMFYSCIDICIRVTTWQRGYLG